MSTKIRSEIVITKIFQRYHLRQEVKFQSIKKREQPLALETKKIQSFIIVPL